MTSAGRVRSAQAPAVVAVVPAAGSSTRFGAPKLVADVDGQPLLERTLRSLLDADVDRIVLVTAPGGAFASVPAASDPRVETVVNPDPSRGMFSSIQAGLRHVPDAALILVLPADMPFVPPAVVRHIVSVASTEERAVVPVYAERRGHPVAIPGRYRAGLLTADPTSNLKAALANVLPEPLREVPWPSDGVVRDVDVPEDITPVTRVANATSPYVRMAELSQAGTPFGVATVVRTQGSTPQVVGAKLILTPDSTARPIGTLGGGCVEADAIDALREVLGGGAGSLREYQLNEELAWNTGLVCGGTMWILAEPGPSATTAGGRTLLPDAVDAASGGRPIAFVTRTLRSGRQTTLSGRVAVLADGRLIGTFGEATVDDRSRDLALDQMRQGTPKLVSLDDDTDLLIEPVVSRPHLVVAGGGHVAKALARQARLLDFDVTILEDRPEFSDPSRFDGATVVGGDVPTSVGAFDYTPQTYLVIATRGHKLDADCVLAASRTRVGYIGLLGSRRKTILVNDMLRAEGVADDRIAAMRAPVGLDLGGRTPAEIALAVLAEITQLRYSGSGRALSRLSP